MHDSDGLPPNASPSTPPLQAEDGRHGSSRTSSGRRWEQVPWERWGWILFVGLFLAAVPYVLYRTTRASGSDFPLFYRSGQYLLEHGARDPNSKFAHYLPSADVVVAMLAWMPLPLAALAWYAINALSWVFLLTAIRRYLLSGYSPTVARQAVLAAGLLVLPLMLDHLCIGAFHVVMVWLMVAGLGRVSEGRSWSGGLMLGLAVWVKLLPLLGVGYLVLKRKWLPAVVAVVAAIVVDMALSLAAFGPATTWQLHGEWWQTEAQGTRNRMLIETGPIDEDRLTNQSVTITVRRLLTHMGCGHNPARDTVALGHLTPAQVQTVYTAVMGLLGLGILVFCRRPGRDLSPDQWSAEIALLVLSTLWFSPLVWSYHPTAATPALAIVMARAAKHLRLAQTVAVVWLLSQILLGWPVARATGVLLWANLFVGGALVWTSMRATPASSQDAEPAAEPDRAPAQRRPLANRQDVPA